MRDEKQAVADREDIEKINFLRAKVIIFLKNPEKYVKEQKTDEEEVQEAALAVYAAFTPGRLREQDALFFLIFANLPELNDHKNFQANQTPFSKLIEETAFKRWSETVFKNEVNNVKKSLEDPGYFTALIYKQNLLNDLKTYKIWIDAKIRKSKFQNYTIWATAQGVARHNKIKAFLDEPYLSIKNSYEAIQDMHKSIDEFLGVPGKYGSSKILRGIMQENLEISKKYLEAHKHEQPKIFIPLGMLDMPKRRGMW